MAIAYAKPGIGRIRPHMIGAAAAMVPPPAILLNSNESVYGAGTHAVAAARAAATGLERYLEAPDGRLAPAIADRFGLIAERITVGQGSDDLLSRLARAYLGPGTDLIRSANGYLKVPNYAHANDAEAVSVADDNFVPSVDRMIATLSDRTRIVYLANPENPAGTMLPGREVRRLHAALPDHVLLVIDSAYEEYVDDPDHEPPHLLVEAAENVVMCRTFSKIFGLAGARIGWAYGSDAVIDTLRRISLTFPVAAPSAAAALAALEDRAHTEHVRAVTLRDRAWLAGELAALGLVVIPSQANFILAGFPDPDRTAAGADAALRARGIAVRRFPAPAYRDYIRITIGRRQELDAALGVLGDYLGGGA